MELFQMNNMDIVKYWTFCFSFEVPNELLIKTR